MVLQEESAGKLMFSAIWHISTDAKYTEGETPTVKSIKLGHSPP